MWWEKVKVVKGKKGIAALLEQIRRAKVDLILTHQNASRYQYYSFLHSDSMLIIFTHS